MLEWWCGVLAVVGPARATMQIEGVFTSHANPKYFLFHPSHRIFRRMHEALNVGKKDN
jgi:hypothetical protein